MACTLFLPGGKAMQVFLGYTGLSRRVHSSPRPIVFQFRRIDVLVAIRRCSTEHFCINETYDQVYENNAGFIFWFYEESLWLTGVRQ